MSQPVDFPIPPEAARRHVAMPVGFVTTGRRLLIIGGGHETILRVQHARRFDWQAVTVVAAAILPEWRDAAAGDARFSFHERTPAEADVQAADLVIKDCPTRPDCCRVVDWCRAHRVPLNAIDKPAQCDLYYASFFTRGPLIVSILSGGHAPALTSVFRRWLERKVGPGWLLAACLMAELRARLPSGQPRMDLLKRLARDEELQALVEANDEVEFGAISRMYFAAYELSVLPPHQRKATVDRLRERAGMPMLVLETCQRLECFGLNLPEPEPGTIQNTWKAAEAFERLARIAAGLESRILGELEILGQVRTAYKTFRDEASPAHSRLDRVFQDALSLAREARRESGIDKNLISLGALASRALMEQVAPSEPVAVVGAGSIASSVARYLSKRGNHPVRVASRCPENAFQLAQQVGGFAHGLDDLAQLFDGVKGIVTATAAPHAIIYPPHLQKAHRPLIVIDLGAPADCHAEVKGMPDISYVSLEQVEERAQYNSAERRDCGQKAAAIIREGALAWARKHAA